MRLVFLKMTKVRWKAFVLTVMVSVGFLYPSQSKALCPTILHASGEQYCGTETHAFTLSAWATLDNDPNNMNHLSGTFVWEKEVSSNWVVVSGATSGVLLTDEFTSTTTKRYRATMTFSDGNCEPLSRIFTPTFQPVPAAPTVAVQKACGLGGILYVTPNTNGRPYEWYYNSVLLSPGNLEAASLAVGKQVKFEGSNLVVENITSTISGFSLTVYSDYCGSNSYPQSVSFAASYVPLPTVTIGSGIPSIICPEASPIALTMGSPTGGVWKLDNVELNPQTHLPGQPSHSSHTLTYRYTDNEGCSNTASTSFDVIRPDYPYYGLSYTSE